MAKPSPVVSPRSLIIPLGGMIVCVFLWPALLTFDAGDWPSPNQFPHNEPATNACGHVGAAMAYYLHYFVGDGAYPLLLFATLAAAIKLIRGSIGGALERAIGLALVVACTSASAHLISAAAPQGLPVGHGGLIGFSLGALMAEHLSTLGTLIVVGSSFLVGLLFATEGWVLKVPSMVKRAGLASGGAVIAARHAVAAISFPKTAPAEGIGSAERRGLVGAPARPAKRRAARAEKPVGEGGIVDALESQEPSDDVIEDDAVETDEDAAGTDADDDEYEYEYEYEEEDEEQDEDTEDRAQRLKKAAQALAGPKVNFPSAEQTSKAEPYPRQIENWTLPDLGFLAEPEYAFTQQQEVVVREQAAVLERTLGEFRLDARVVEINTGPVITMFELTLGAGIKVSQIASLSNDIARALKAHAIRVVAPISGKNTVGVEVPNSNKEKVRLKELMTLAGKRASRMHLPFFLGKDAGGMPLVADITQMPHVLIAGTTGSGKSVCMNSMILSLLMTKRPDHVKMILIDPKMVELSQFKDVPHLMCPIVTDMQKAERILEWAVTTMEERYALLAETGVKNIAHYNQLGEEGLYRRLRPQSDQEKARIVTQLPYIVIVIDELADLMMTAAKEVEHHLSRLAQKSRAVGVHIAVATQRPEAKVVTGLIKSNLPSRICFRVSSRMDSRIVLDQNGGEVLMGQGDMLFLPPGSHKLVRAQGTFLDEDEVAAVLEDLASRAQPEFHPGLMRIKTPTQEEGSSVRDPLFDKAVRIVLESRRGSVSLLQRRLTVGYSRASRLIDQMSEAGIVGEYKGSQAREVVMTLEEWDALRAQVAKDCADGYAADEEDDASDGLDFDSDE